MCETWEKIWNSHDHNEQELLAQIAFAKSAEEVLEDIICYKRNYLIEFEDSVITQIQPSFLQDKDSYEPIKVLRIQLTLPYWDESIRDEIDGVSGIEVEVEYEEPRFATIPYQGAAYGMPFAPPNQIVRVKIMLREDQLSKKSREKLQSLLGRSR